MKIRIEVNGQSHEREVEPRLTLADFIRDELALKGTHLACEHGFCGNCNVLVDGVNVRSCLMFAVQANGRAVETVESLAGPEGELNDLQRDSDKRWDLGWVYTVIAGVLNIMVIYDALAGPAFSMATAPARESEVRQNAIVSAPS